MNQNEKIKCILCSDIIDTKTENTAILDLPKWNKAHIYHLTCYNRYIVEKYFCDNFGTKKQKASFQIKTQLGKFPNYEKDAGKLSNQDSSVDV